MPEVASRSGASRGRGGGRGGRGGHAGRGGRSTTTSRVNGDSSSPFDKEGGDIAELRNLYGPSVPPIKELFDSWSEIDILYLLKETEGDADIAVTKILDGSASKWDEVPKKQTVSRKAKESASAPVEPVKPVRPVRNEAPRGRGKPADRGTRAPRGRIVSSANGVPRAATSNVSVPTDESPAWCFTTQDDDVPAVARPAAPASKSWASLLRQPQAPKLVAKPKEAPKPELVETFEESSEPATQELESALKLEAPLEEEVKEPETVDPAPVDETKPVEEEPQSAPESVETAPQTQAPPKVPVALPVAKPAPVPVAVPTVPAVPATTYTSSPALAAPATAAPASSTSSAAVPVTAPVVPTPAVPTPAASTPAAPTPVAAPAAPVAPVLAVTPNKTPARYRILEQQEAVRMPENANHSVEATSLQFGFLNVAEDEEREQSKPQSAAPVETPAPTQSTAPSESAASAPVPTAPAAAPAPTPAVAAPATAPIPVAHHPNPAPGFGRDPYSAHKYDTYGGPIPQQGGVDGFSAPPSQATGFPNGPNDFASLYEQRPFAGFYGGTFGHSPQEGLPPAQQRSFGNYQAPTQGDIPNQFSQASRFGGVGADNQNSGHNTPVPTSASQQQQPQPPSSGPASNVMYQQQQYGAQYYPNYYGYGTGYPYGQHQGGFNAPGFSKNSMYGSYPTGFEQHNTTAGFNQVSHRDNGVSAGAGDYGRQGGAQGGAPGFSGFNVHDSFSRGPAGYQGQTNQAYNASAQAGAPGTSDDLKTSFNDNKVGAGGPSPALSGARPGSAANNGAQGNQGLPPQSMSGYNAYPHTLHNSYGASGQGNYSSYQSGFNSFYAGPQHRGTGGNGWGHNYSH